MDGFDAEIMSTERIGEVVSVNGSQVVTLIDKAPGGVPRGSFGDLQMGTLVKIPKPHSIAYGIITGLTVPFPAHDDGNQLEILELTMTGESVTEAAPDEVDTDPFRRGIRAMPTLGDPVFKATREDLARVYAPPETLSVQIGTIHQDSHVPAHVLIDELLGKHFAILGTTGAGKSCASARILHAMLEARSNAHMIILDPHGEYAPAFGERAELLTPQNFELPYWLLSFEELLEVLFGAGYDSGSLEATILADLIPQAKAEFPSPANQAVAPTADTPVPYKLSDLIKQIDSAMGSLDKPESLQPYRRVKSRLTAVHRDPRYAFMFGGIVVRDNIAQIFSQILRIPVDNKPATIIDLSGVPSEIVNAVVAVLCRLVFDFAVWSDRAVPILMVCEEAHRYAPNTEDPAFALSKGALSRIAKEGRKYGVSLCVISQRASKVSTDLISQCNTIFGLRMTNNDDQHFLRGALSEASSGLFSCLPALRNGEAIAVGQGVPIPMRLNFDRLPDNQRPYSRTASFSAGWSEDSHDSTFISEVVKHWRMRTR